MKKKKTNLKTINRLLNKEWAQLIKLIAKYKCEYCNKTTTLNSHHIYGRSKLSTRWDVDNGMCLCSGCHILSSSFSAHQTPLDFTYWIRKKRGNVWFNRLQKKAHTTVHYALFERKEILKDLQSKVKEKLKLQ